MARPTAGYIKTLDGWRAIAIFGVLLNHAYPITIGRFTLEPIQAFGERGVDLFFAISGLLICSKLLEEHRDTGAISLKNFYLRRLFRIQPAAMTYLAFIWVLALAGLLHPSAGGMLSSLLSWRNLYGTFGGHAVGDDHYTSHFWSLAIEEHFYLILPVLLVVAWKGRSLVLGIFSGALFCWPYIAAHYGWVPTATPPAWRTDLTLGSLFIPAYLACLLTDAKVKERVTRFTQHYVCLGVILMAMVASLLMGGRMMGPLTCLGFPLIVVSTVLHPEGWIGRLLETAPLTFLGRMSYSIYLWQNFFTSTPIWGVQREPWNFMWALVIAALSYYLVEKPMIRLGHRLMQPKPAVGFVER